MTTKDYRVQDIALSSKTNIPQLGFGTWMNKDESECKNAIQAALEIGFRHFDTAQIYENEQFIGEALAGSNVPRSELFITTKIWNENMFWDDIIPSLDESLAKLKTDYADLLLLHFPVTELRRPAWRRMEDILKSGKARSIGVSNYTISHLEELLKECSIKPSVNQVELHVFLQQPELIKYCKDNDIVVEAYSPLAHGYIMDDPMLLKIAVKHKKTPSQVMIRWCIDQGLVPLPKAVGRNHIEQNFDVFNFKLDADDLKQLASLERDLRTCWDPTRVA